MIATRQEHCYNTNIQQLQHKKIPKTKAGALLACRLPAAVGAALAPAAAAARVELRRARPRWRKELPCARAPATTTVRVDLHSCARARDGSDDRGRRLVDQGRGGPPLLVGR
jgi:hypothetical protein